MLNGDAHHSKRRDGELRIGRCRVFKDSNDRSIAERRRLIISFPGFWFMPHRSQQSYLHSETQCRLLYVGSDLALLEFLRSTFYQPKYHVVSCPNRLSAEMFIKSQIPYELFIFDHEMRDRAAFDLARLVGSLKHRQSLPSIVVGSEPKSTVAEFTLASGGSEYVQKADHFLAIHEAINRLLEPASRD